MGLARKHAVYFPINLIISGYVPSYPRQTKLNIIFMLLIQLMVFIFLYCRISSFACSNAVKFMKANELDFLFNTKLRVV